MASTRKVALIAGVLFLITFVVSIAALILYAPALHPAKYILGAGADTRVRFGAVCELILIIANIGSAVMLFPILTSGSTKASRSDTSQLVSLKARSSPSASSVSLRS